MTTKSEISSQHTFIVLLSTKGIECYAEVTDYLEQSESYNKELSWAILQGSERPVQPERSMLKKMLTLIYGTRADTDEQMIVYEFTTTLDKTTFDKLVQFDSSRIIDLVKQNGKHIYPNN